MKRFVFFVGLLLLIAAGAATVLAQVVPECPVPPPCPDGGACPLVECVPPIQPGVFTNPDWLKVDYHRVNVTVENQIATTEVALKFTNEGSGLAEGTFVFPLPQGAAVEQLVMVIDGVSIEAKILPADEARAIYDEIVRQYRDPALLEYVGTQAVQANIFPIPPGDERTIEITYSQALEVDNGLIKFTYPMDVTSLTSSRTVESASVSVHVVSTDPISNIYSPSHDVAISRTGDTEFRAGFEASDFAPEDDFTLYYGIENDRISANLLSYRESASEDGFFMLMVQPPLSIPADDIQPRDLIIVLDQSGSMQGDKWTQAQAAATYVLDNLNPRDRFNVVLFSTGWRVFSDGLEDASVAGEAADWVNSAIAEGGTDINGALTTALDMVDPDRDTTILFLTDGLATEGETNPTRILENLTATAPDNVRIFSFGVGDDIDTILIDQIVQAFNGLSAYVRPFEQIDEEVASLYSKISAPVLTDVAIDFGSIRTDTVYPGQPYPDLYAGTQMTVVGRYRDGADDQTITISGTVNGETRTFVYDGVDFRERSGGEPFVARLWATRRIGDLLNSIRLNGESAELVDSIVNLSVRYGIITPYTSFLIEEDDILTQRGREEAAASFSSEAQELANTTSGARAVDAADQFGGFAAAEAPAPAMQFAATPSALPTMNAVGTTDQGGALSQPPGDFGGGGSFDDEQEAFQSDRVAQQPVQTVGDKTFILRDGVWTDTTFAPDTMQTEKIVFLSDAYFDLIASDERFGDYFALGERVIVVLDGVAYEVVSA